MGNDIPTSHPEPSDPLGMADIRKLNAWKALNRIPRKLARNSVAIVSKAREQINAFTRALDAVPRMLSNDNSESKHKRIQIADEIIEGADFVNQELGRIERLPLAILETIKLSGESRLIRYSQSSNLIMHTRVEIFENTPIISEFEFSVDGYQHRAGVKIRLVPYPMFNNPHLIADCPYAVAA
jgi:hypothetical protein